MARKKLLRVLYSRTQFWFGLKAGGSVTHTAGVIKELEQKGEVEFLGNEELYGLEFIPSKIVKPINLKYLPNTYREFLYNFRYKRYIIQRSLDFMPTFVYHRFSGLSFSTASACRDLNIPLVLEFNSSDSWKLKYWVDDSNYLLRIHYWILRKIVKRTERYNLSNAYLIVVVSRPLKEQLEGIGIPGDRILVNPNGVDVDKFKPGKQEDRSRLKRELGISENIVVIGFSGTFGQWHGIPELTEAIIRINDDQLYNGGVFFILFGDGILRHKTQEKIDHYKNVLFTGTIEFKHIEKYLDICGILLAPHGKTPDGRQFFGSPTKLFEYMAMSKGIVASNLGQIGEVLTHMENCYLVEPGDVDQLVTGIKYLVENKEEVNRLGSNARSLVEKSFTWESNVERMIAAFNNIQHHGSITS